MDLKKLNITNYIFFLKNIKFFSWILIILLGAFIYGLIFWGPFFNHKETSLENLYFGISPKNGYLEVIDGIGRKLALIPKNRVYPKNLKKMKS
jgi:hypothetical protein